MSKGKQRSERELIEAVVSLQADGLELLPAVGAIVGKGKGLSDVELEMLEGVVSEQENALPEYADSMKAASSMMGFSLELLKLAKRRGCQGFKGGRVYLSEVEKFILDNKLEEDDSLGERDSLDIEIKREELRRKRFANDLIEGKYMSIDENRAALQEIAVKQRNHLKATLEKRFPLLAESPPAS